MCGIAGVLGTVGTEESRRAALDAMLGSMISRGPDGEGRFIDNRVALGMRRLSILDLEHGWQPMKTPDESIIVFQNGEIYNHVELREELSAQDCIFITSCDTEVLLHGYQKWGIDGLLNRVDGMYAIAIYDRSAGIVHLVRDRFGEKPLFYMTAAKGFAFSSNTDALSMLKSEPATLSPEGLDQYLAMHFVAGDTTVLQGIHRVLPGFRMEVRLSDLRCTTHRYYQIESTWQTVTGTDHLNRELTDSIQRRLVADVPVGVFLSGGLDSSLVASIATRFSPGIKTFSIGFPDKRCDESPFAEEVSKYIGSQHYHFMFNEDDFLDLLPTVAGKLDEPVGDQALLPLYVLSEAASREVTVVLSGEGADELFGGYGYYKPFCGQRQSVLEWVRQLVGRDRQKNELPDLNRLIDNTLPVTPSGFPLLTDTATRVRLLGREPVFGAYETWLMSVLDRAGNPLQRATGTDLLTWLPDDLLVKLDRICMMHSIEGRAPFLQPRLAAMAMSLDPALRFDGRIRKKALRHVGRQHLPRAIADRQKQGFVLPMARWLSEWFKAHGNVQTYFSSREIAGVDMGVLIEIVEEDLQRGIQRERLVFAVVMLGEWTAQYQERISGFRTRVPESIREVWAG